RTSLKDTYKQIIMDLEESVLSLPNFVEFPTRPSKAAAFGLLARTYLQMRDYEQAKKYSDSTLLIKNELMDYNTVDSTLRIPFKQFNKEVLFHQNMFSVNGYVDDELYNSYQADDLRKTLYFDQNNGF